MKRDSFASSLVRKGERAIRSAQLSLRDGDPDNAVNRSYYAMFNVARAALLNAGVSEAELPRTHRGVIEAFRIHAVQTGRIDPELASSLSRTENLRLKADYTGAEIDAGVAKEVVAHAEKFVRTVERVFGLEGRPKDAGASRSSTEEMRRQAAENWRRNYYEKGNEIPGSEQESTDSQRDITENDERHQSDTGMDFDPER
jgi:uncharacterized protein (UPF0332 family)